MFEILGSQEKLLQRFQNWKQSSLRSWRLSVMLRDRRSLYGPSSASRAHSDRQCAPTSLLQLPSSFLWTLEIKILLYMGDINMGCVPPSFLISASSRLFLKKDYETRKKPIAHFFLTFLLNSLKSLLSSSPKCLKESYHCCEADQIIRYTVKINALKHSLSIPKQTLDFIHIKWKSQGLRNRIHKYTC